MFLDTKLHAAINADKTRADRLHEELQEWGRYRRLTPSGYNSESTEYKAIYGDRSDVPAGPRAPRWRQDENIMAIHVVYRTMPECDRIALEAGYVSRGSPQARARKHGYKNQAQMYRAISSARSYVMGRLDAQRQNEGTN